MKNAMDSSVLRQWERERSKKKKKEKEKEAPILQYWLNAIKHIHT